MCIEIVLWGGVFENVDAHVCIHPQNTSQLQKWLDPFYENTKVEVLTAHISALALIDYKTIDVKKKKKADSKRQALLYAKSLMVWG